MRILKVMFCLCLTIIFSSCYSVRFQVENGQWEPADTEVESSYAGYNVRTLDTIIKRKITTGEDYFNIFDCESDALHTVEYRATLGGILLNGITFGRKKKVKIKYVCIKP